MGGARYIPFGERVGAIVPPLAMPLDDVSQEFRVAVWNRVAGYFSGDSTHKVASVEFGIRMANDLNSDSDTWRKSPYYECTKLIKALVMEGPWHFVYELLQGFPRWYQFVGGSTARWHLDTNQFLEEHKSPYRFTNGLLTPITSEQELESVSSASQASSKYGLATGHLAKALTKFSLRPKADYENAIKEAASAVESALKVATGEADVGPATRRFASTFSVHTALMESANKLFGYASDRDGVRHGATGTGKPVDFDEAKLAIVSASAWLNFIVAKAP